MKCSKNLRVVFISVALSLPTQSLADLHGYEVDFSGVSKPHLYCLQDYPEAEEAKAVALQRLKSMKGRAEERLLVGSKIEKVKVGCLHQIYFSTSLDVKNSQLLSEAKLGGLSCLVINEEDIAVAELNMRYTQDGGVVEHAFSSGPIFDKILSAIKLLPGDPSYKLSIIYVYPLGFAAIWLKGDTENKLIPIETFSEELRLSQPYTEEQVVSILRRDNMMAGKNEL